MRAAEWILFPTNSFILNHLHGFLSPIASCNIVLHIAVCKFNDCAAVYIVFHTVSRNLGLAAIRERFSTDFSRAGILPVKWHLPSFHTTWEILHNSLLSQLLKALKWLRLLAVSKLVQALESWGGSASAWDGLWRHWDQQHTNLEKNTKPCYSFPFPVYGCIHFPSPSLTVQSAVPPNFIFCAIVYTCANQI